MWLLFLNYQTIYTCKFGIIKKKLNKKRNFIVTNHSLKEIICLVVISLDCMKKIIIYNIFTSVLIELRPIVVLNYFKKIIFMVILHIGIKLE